MVKVFEQLGIGCLFMLFVSMLIFLLSSFVVWSILLQRGLAEGLAAGTECATFVSFNADLDKYLFVFEQIQFGTWTNTIWYLDKYNLVLGDYNLVSGGFSCMYGMCNVCLL